MLWKFKIFETCRSQARCAGMFWKLLLNDKREIHDFQAEFELPMCNWSMDYRDFMNNIGYFKHKGRHARLEKLPL